MITESDPVVVSARQPQKGNQSAKEREVFAEFVLSRSQQKIRQRRIEQMRVVEKRKKSRKSS